MNKDLSVVIVTWNSVSYIDACLNSLIKSCEGYKYEIIIVDNNSSDNTCNKIRNEFPSAIILAQNTNHGFGQGNNIGIKKAQGKKVLLLNPDTVVNKQAITKLFNFLDDNSRVVAVGPEQLNEYGEIIFNLSRFTLRGVCEYLLEKVVRLFAGRHRIIFKKPYKVDYLNLGCVMTAAHIWRTGIRFDPKIFIYGEEYDFFGQLKKRRMQVYFLRDCKIYHFREKSIALTNKKFWFALKSFLYLTLQRRRKS